MSYARPSPYLEAKVLTAPPHRLHLMLIEGAIRFGRQADDALRRGDPAAAAEPLMRVVDIVGEMLAGVRDQKSNLNKKLTELYWYLFRRVSQAKIHCDAQTLREALRLLEYERRTWLTVCERLAAGETGTLAPGAGTAGPSVVPKAGFSLEG
jgi:flagellar protein FliS